MSADEQTLAIDGLHDAEALLMEALHRIKTAWASLPEGLKAAVLEAGVASTTATAHRSLSELLIDRPDLPASAAGVEQ